MDAARVALLQREERAQEAEVGAALVDRVAAEDELRAGCQLERVEVGLAIIELPRADQSRRRVVGTRLDPRLPPWLIRRAARLELYPLSIEL